MPSFITVENDYPVGLQRPANGGYAPQCRWVQSGTAPALTVRAATRRDKGADGSTAAGFASRSEITPC